MNGDGRDKQAEHALARYGADAPPEKGSVLLREEKMIFGKPKPFLPTYCVIAGIHAIMMLVLVARFKAWTLCADKSPDWAYFTIQNGVQVLASPLQLLDRHVFVPSHLRLLVYVAHSLLIALLLWGPIYLLRLKCQQNQVLGDTAHKLADPQH